MGIKAKLNKSNPNVSITSPQKFSMGLKETSDNDSSEELVDESNEDHNSSAHNVMKMKKQNSGQTFNKQAMTPKGIKAKLNKSTPNLNKSKSPKFSLILKKTNEDDSSDSKLNRNGNSSHNFQETNEKSPIQDIQGKKTRPTTPQARKRKMYDGEEETDEQQSPENGVKKIKEEVSVQRPQEEEETDEQQSPEKETTKLWRNNDILTLVKRIEEQSSELLDLGALDAIDQIEWDKVAFNNFTSEDCRKLWKNKLSVCTGIDMFEISKYVLQKVQEHPDIAKVKLRGHSMEVTKKFMKNSSKAGNTSEKHEDEGEEDDSEDEEEEGESGDEEEEDESGDEEEEGESGDEEEEGESGDEEVEDEEEGESGDEEVEGEEGESGDEEVEGEEGESGDEEVEDEEEGESGDEQMENEEDDSGDE